MGIYFSADIETTGLNPSVHKIIEVAFLMLDSSHERKSLDDLRAEGKVFHYYVDVNDEDLSRGDEFALNMNREIIQKIKERSVDNIISEKELIPTLVKWLERNGVDYHSTKMKVAGKNFGVFDYQFIKRLPGFDTGMMSHRFIDPAMFFLDWETMTPPSLSECLGKAGLDEKVSHTAVEDSYQVYELLSHS